MADKKDEVLDPVLVAALIEQPDEDEEDKKTREELAKVVPDDEDDSDEDEDQSEEDDDKDNKKSDEDEADDKKDEDADDKKADSQDQIQKEDPRQSDKSRKERREERKLAWLKSIKEGGTTEEARAKAIQADPSYKPLDYQKAEEFKIDELAADRAKYGNNKFAEGAQLERQLAQQERFWDKVEMEAKMLTYDPKLQFLNEDNKEAFDEDKAADINEFYLNAIGYQETPIFYNGQPVFDPATGKQKVSITVQRTDLGYEKFVRGFVDMMEDWTDEAQADTVKNIVKQKSNQGIRPGGTSKRGIGKLRPGSISNMSDEEFEKHEADIDRQILEML